MLLYYIFGILFFLIGELWAIGENWNEAFFNLLAACFWMMVGIAWHLRFERRDK